MDITWQFSCCETRLYFYLVKTANSLGWLDNWTHSDGRTSANVGVSLNAIKTARNKLVQAGLIDVKQGGKYHGDKTRYQILTPKPQPNLIPNLIPKPQPNLDPLNKLNSNTSSDEEDITKTKIVIGADAPKHPPKSIETFEKRETDFYNSIAEYKDVYPKETLRAFFNYWREPNKSKSKMKFEQERTWDLKLRLERWVNNDFNKQNTQNGAARVQNSGAIGGKKPHDTSKMEPGTRIPL